MSKGNMKVLGGLLGLLLLYIGLVEVPAMQDKVKQEQIFSFGASDVAKMDLETGNGEKSSLELTAEGWFFISPFHDRASGQEVAYLLHHVATLKTARILGRSGSLEKYGLEQPFLHYSFHTHTGIATLSIGSKTVTENEYYATSSSREAVFTITGESLQQIKRKQAELRERRLLFIHKENLKHVLIRQGKQQIWLERWKTGWMITKPVADAVRANYERIEQLLDEIMLADAVGFIDAAKPKGKPLTEVLIGLKDGSEKKISIYPAGADGLLPVRARDGAMLLLPAEFAKILPEGWQRFQEKRVMPLNYSKVSKVSFVRGASRKTFTKEGATWQVDGSKEQVKQQHLNVYLAELEAAERAGFLPNVAKSVGKKRLVIELSSPQGNMKIDFYSLPNKSFMADSGYSQPYRMSKKLYKRLTRDETSFIDKRVFKLGIEKLSSATIERGGKSWQINRSSGGWMINGEVADEKKTEKLLAGLLATRYKRLISFEEEPEKAEVIINISPISSPAVQLHIIGYNDRRTRLLARLGGGEGGMEIDKKLQNYIAMERLNELKK